MSSNICWPVPVATGVSSRWNSSTRPFAIRVWSSGPLPYFTMFPPGWRLRPATNSATSAGMMVAFHAASFSVLDATNLGIEFIRSTKGSGVMA